MRRERREESEDRGMGEGGRGKGVKGGEMGRELLHTHTIIFYN